MPLPDLNQLRTFVVLFELRSLTAAAARLHVTQPTVSYTLRQLRQRFADDLFHRSGHTMTPTPRAQQLFGPLHEALAQIDATVSAPEAFDPALLDGELTLALTSIGEQTFLPPIMPVLEREAPALHLRVQRLDSDQVEDRLLRGTVDLAITVSLMESARLWRTPIRSVEYVALSAAAHPLPRTGPEMFAGRRFVRVSARGGHVYPRQAMIERGLMSQVTLTVEEYSTVPAVLEATDLVVLLPRHVAEVFRGWFPRLLIAELPWPAHTTPVALYTRGQSGLSPAQQWFRTIVFDAVAAGEYRSG